MITVELPEHIVGFETAEIATVGVVLTTIVLVAVFALKHPEALVPDNVYVVVVLGDTVKDVPVNAPGFRV